MTDTAPAAAGFLAQELAAENTLLHRQLRDALARAAALDERLRHMQDANEAIYRDDYDATGGPHFDTAQPFGSVPRGRLFARKEVR